jgi:hypothetical protein
MADNCVSAIMKLLYGYQRCYVSPLTVSRFILHSAKNVAFGVLELDQGTHRRYRELLIDDCAAVCFHGRLRFINIIDADGAFETDNPVSDNRFRSLLQSPANSRIVLGSRSDQKKPRRSPGSKLPSKAVFVKTHCSRQIVSVNRKMSDIVRHWSVLL